MITHQMIVQEIMILKTMMIIMDRQMKKHMKENIYQYLGIVLVLILVIQIVLV